MVLQAVSNAATKSEFTKIDAIPQLVRDARAAFDRGVTQSVGWRLEQLDAIRRMIQEREKDIVGALGEDLGKPELEAYAAEVAYTLSELEIVRKNLRDWVKPKKVKTPIFALPGASHIHKDPLGVVLVISPWNYPFQLAMAPLVGAVAAGNSVVLKPSEVAPATSALLAKLLFEYADPQCIKVVEGAVAETTALLAERFDYVFYTGNGVVGRIVMEAAAKHLTPVTLELGGKSPCIVDRDVDVEVAARRIAWGKFYNAGQTCVAPDYVLVHEQVHERLLDCLAFTVREFYGDNPQDSDDYGRIVNGHHHQRLVKLLGSGKAVVGGEADEEDRYVAPTVLRDVSPDSPVMAEEIFGPILPVLPVRSIEEAISFVNARPKPLALYVFSSEKSVQQQVLRRTTSGGACVNHAWLHLTNPDLPFGGVGASGMGAYHGKATFDTFTHERSVLTKPTRMDPPILYPPYTPSKKKWIRRLL